MKCVCHGERKLPLDEKIWPRRDPTESQLPRNKLPQSYNPQTFLSSPILSHLPTTLRLQPPWWIEHNLVLPNPGKYTSVGLSRPGPREQNYPQEPGEFKPHSKPKFRKKTSVFVFLKWRWAFRRSPCRILPITSCGPGIPAVNQRRATRWLTE